MFKLATFVFTIKWNDISFSISQKLLRITSAIIMQDYQFKYISHSLCIFYPETFHISAPTLHIIEWKGSCRSLFLFNCSLNLRTFRTSHLVEMLELMALPLTQALISKYHPCSQSSSSTLICVMAAYDVIYDIFVRAAWTDSSEDLMINALIWSSAISE